MEFVGVRNIELEIPYVSQQWQHGVYELNVDSNHVLKIISISTGTNWVPPQDFPVEQSYSNQNQLMLL